MKNKTIKQIMIIVFIIFATLIGYYKYKHKIPEVKIVKIKKIVIEPKLKLEGVIVPKDVESLHKKVRMKVKKVFAIPGTHVKKGDVLITFYGVTKDGYNEVLDSEVREELNTEMIGLDVLKKKLEGLKLEAQVLRVKLRDARKTEAVMKTLLEQDQATSSEVVGAKSAVMLTNLDYQKVLKDMKVVEKTIALKSIVIEKELTERGSNTIAPEDGIIVDISVKDGENVIPAITLITLAKQKSGLEVNFKIPDFDINAINISDKVEIVKSYENIDSVKKKVKTIAESSGLVYRLSEIGVDLKVKESYFKGLVGMATLDTEKGFQINDRVKISVYGTDREFINGISTFSIFDISKDKKQGFVYVIENEKTKKIEVELGVEVNHKYEILNLPLGTQLIGNPYGLKEGIEVKSVTILEE